MDSRYLKVWFGFVVVKEFFYKLHERCVRLWYFICFVTFIKTKRKSMHVKSLLVQWISLFCSLWSNLIH